MRTPDSWFGHPATVVALAVLVLNDHVLKAAHPGWVTGKLSDAAGLVLAPALVAVVCRLRGRWVAVGVVGTLFTVIKLWPYAAEQASSFWGLIWVPSLVRADPTDLLALPFLGVAAWTWQSARRRPAAGRLVRALRVAVLLPLALLGVAATSEYPEASMAIRVISADGELFVEVGNADYPHREPNWARSTDDGATWTRVHFSQNEQLRERFPGAYWRTCSAAYPRLCYQAMPDSLAVQVATDGVTWVDSWRVSDRDRDRLIRYYEAPGDDPNYWVRSFSVAVHDVEGGHIVVLANGLDGLAVRDVSGTWKRIGFPAGLGAVPLPELGEQAYPSDVTVPLAVAAIVLLAGVTVIVGAVWGASIGLGRPSAWWTAPVALLVVVPCLLVEGSDAARHRDEFPFTVFGTLLGVVGTLVVAVVLTGVVVWRRSSSDRSDISDVPAPVPHPHWVGATLPRGYDSSPPVSTTGFRRRGRWVLAVWAAGMLTAAIQAVVWLGMWAGPEEPGTGRVVLLATIGCLPGLVLALLAGRSLREPPAGSDAQGR